MRGEEGVVAGPRLSRDTDLRVLPPDAALHILLAQTQGEASCGKGGSKGEGGRSRVRVQTGEGVCKECWGGGEGWFGRVLPDG